MKKWDLGIAGLLALALAGCGTTTAITTAPASATGSASAAAPSATPALTRATTLTVVTHDSFALSKDVLAQFTQKSGYDVTFVAPGDAGIVVNQLVLTKDAPLGDVVYGIDNTFAGRATAAGVVEDYVPATLPADAADLRADGSLALTPIDFGDVCVNADLAWFRAKGLAVPATLDDLTKPAYKDLLVVENPASSSTGLAFLAGTVGAKGDAGWVGYWLALKANGVKVAQGWTDAYTVQFSGSAGKGSRPLVVSYNSSPAAEVKDGVATTRALLDTCLRQVEYAGVIAGSKNEVGARAFVDFLLSPAVQADIPGQMYMNPAIRSTPLPADWVTFGPLAAKPFAVADIASKRDQWIKDWTSTVLG